MSATPQLFRRKAAKPVKAFQWFPEMGEVGGVYKSRAQMYVGFKQYDAYFVDTQGGQQTAVYPGDYIIDDPINGRTVYSKEAFESDFEAVAL